MLVHCHSFFQFKDVVTFESNEIRKFEKYNEAVI